MTSVLFLFGFIRNVNRSPKLYAMVYLFLIEEWFYSKCSEKIKQNVVVSLLLEILIFASRNFNGFARMFLQYYMSILLRNTYFAIPCLQLPLIQQITPSNNRENLLLAKQNDPRSTSQQFLWIIVVITAGHKNNSQQITPFKNLSYEVHKAQK